MEPSSSRRMARTLCLRHSDHLHLAFCHILLMGEAYRIESADPDRGAEKGEFVGVLVFVVGLDEFRNYLFYLTILSVLPVDSYTWTEFSSKPSRYPRLHPPPHHHRPNVSTRPRRCLCRPSCPLPHQKISWTPHLSLIYVWRHVRQSLHRDSAGPSGVLGEPVYADAIGNVWTRFEF